jgi:site-specific recombinase XerD
MPSAKILLRTYQKKKDGTYPIVLRLYDGVRSKFEFTGYSVREDQFRDIERKWITKHPDAALINAKLIERLINADPTTQVRGKCITDYLEIRAKDYDKLNQPDTALKLRRHIVEIKEMGGKDLRFDKINPDWVRHYRAHLIAEHGNGQNTIIHKIGILRRIYHQAVKDGWANGANPFEDLHLKKEPVDKQKLTLDEILKIQKLKLPKGSVLDMARDVFIFAFYAHGMRFQNVYTLEWENINGKILRYQMNKGKKYREIVLQPAAVNILKKYRPIGGKYVFPLNQKAWKDQKEFEGAKGSANALVNASLKSIALMAGVGKTISMHIARHSFAYLLKKKKVDPHVIKDALGHSKMQTTEQYLAGLDDDTINREVAAAFS